MIGKKKILVLSPHPDDGELGAGGTIAKLIEGKAEICWATFSWCEESLGKEDDVKKEFAGSMKKLGVKKTVNFDYRVRRFGEKRQEILEEMIKVRKDFAPDLVLLPCSFDVHQDHGTIHAEGVRAFKQTSILGFEEPWNNFKSRLNFFVELGESHLKRKIESIEQYASQKGKRNYTSAEYLTSLAVVRGQQVNKRYAEAFELLRWVD